MLKVLSDSLQAYWGATNNSILAKPRVREGHKINNNWINAKSRQMALILARWRCSLEFSGNPWSNESDANVEDSDCRVRMLLFFSIVTKSRQDFCLTGLTYGGIAGVFMNTIVVGCLL